MVDTCWREAEVKYKEKITAELAESESQLSNNFYGRIVLRNCSTEQFKRKNSLWLEKQDKAACKRKMFDEILGDESTTTKTKKTKDKAQDKSITSALLQEQMSNYSSEMEALGFGGDDKDSFKKVRQEDSYKFFEQLISCYFTGLMNEDFLL